MKKILLTAVLFLAACTNNSSNSPDQTQEVGDQSPNYAISISDQSLGSSGFSADIVSSSIDFGDTSPSLKEKTALLTITNITTIATPLDVEAIMSSSPGFSIKINRCTAPIAKGKSCQLTLAFSNRGLFDQDTNTVLSINGEPIQLSASVTGQPDPDTTGSAVLELSLDAPFIPATAASYRTLTIKNTGNGTALNVSPQLPSEYSVRLNRCSSTLKPGYSCSIQVLLNNFRSSPTPVSQVPFKVSVASPSVGIKTLSISPISGNIVISYTPAFSAYSPLASSLIACDGSVSSTRSITSCIQDDTLLSVANNLCADSQSSVIIQSPAGNKVTSISHGSETRTCALGSSVQSSVVRSCDSSYFDSGTACSLITYTASYSAYSPLASSLNPCDGSSTATRSVTSCIQHTLSNDSVAVSFCPDSQPTQPIQSPAGNKIVAISNGSETKSCPIGSSVQTFVSRSCNSGFADNGSLCAVIPPATISSVSTPNAKYLFSENIDYTVTYSSSVVVTGSPKLSVSVAGIPDAATYFSGSGTTSLVFRYLAKSSDLGSVTISSPLTLNGGTIKNSTVTSILTFSTISGTVSINQCPTNYIVAPAMAGYTTKAFCVAKYEMKDDGNGVAVSQAAGTPWVSITQPDSITKCAALGSNYALISNAQWQSLSRNIELVPWNWSNGVVGDPNQINQRPLGTKLAANIDDNVSCSGTSSSCDLNTWNILRRVNKLSNGALIWDLSGNAIEFMADTNTTIFATSGNPGGAAQLNDVNYPIVGTLTGSSTGSLTGTAKFLFGPAGSYAGSTAFGSGGISLASAGGILYRGENSMFTVGASVGSSFSSPFGGFRCIMNNN